MGFIAAAFFLGIILLVLFGLVVWTCIMFAIRPKYFYRIWLGIPGLGFVILVGLVCAALFYQSRPSVVFKEAVGFGPTADITFVNSLRDMPIDWDDTHLMFYANDSTINRILLDGFAPIKPSEIINDNTYQSPPWWTPPAGPSVRIYATNTDDPHFHDETWQWTVSHKLLIYDLDSGDYEKRMVYFRYRR